MLTVIKKYISPIHRNSSPISFFKTRKLDKLVALDKYAEIGRLSTGILHDILNPLSSLLLSINSFSRIKSKDDIEKYMKIIVQSGKQMEDLILLVKTYANNEDYISDISINKTIKNVMLLIKYYALKNDIHLVFASNQDIKIKCNHLSFYQVMINLISNAIESYRDIDIKGKKIVIEARDEKKFTYISVKDYGRGIVKDDLNKIFKPFYSTRKESGGSGIGLSTVKYVVENKLKGQIKVESEPNNGSLFIIKIPHYKYL